MWSISILLCGIFLSILYSNKIKSGIKLLNILFDTLVSKYIENKIPITLERINDKQIIKYGDILMNTFEPMYSYDIKCIHMKDNDTLEDETRNFYLRDDTQDFIPLNLIKFKNYCGFTPFTPSSFNLKHLHILIKKITEQEYSVYKFDKSSYINIQEIVDKYENYLLNKKMENILAEAYD